MSVPNSKAGVVFKAAYIASRDARIQSLFSIDDPQIRYQTAAALALKGLAIDEEIDVAGADPFIEMMIRQNDGMKWVPNALQPSLQVSTVGAQRPNPPFVPYDPDHMPEGGLLVSTNPDDFKPIAVQAPPATPAAQPAAPQAGMRLIGAPKAFGLFDVNDLARTLTIPDGFVWTQEGDGHVYVFHVVALGAKLWERVS